MPKFPADLSILYLNAVYLVTIVTSDRHFYKDENTSKLMLPNLTFCDSRVKLLHEENEKLQLELDFINNKNKELQLHTSKLMILCNSTCYYEGNIYSDGDVWYPDPCMSCTCSNHEVSCYKSHHSIHCAFHCTKNTCFNGGECQLGSPTDSVQCKCPKGFTGPLCEQSMDSCMPLEKPGSCHYDLPLWIFDESSNQCLPVDSGCYESGTVFTSSQSCANTCLQGTCCHRMISEEIENIICQSETLQNCQKLCHEREIDVLGFYPGIVCPHNGCAVIASKVCHSGISLYSPGSSFTLGCESCECREQQMVCSCTVLNTRKEIRDLTFEERLRYQRAVASLTVGEDSSVWSSLRNLYATHVMHANSATYFLFWNRIFLRTMERHLQNYDCSVTLPYYDFTLDAGSFTSSIVWDTDYFGLPAATSHYCQKLMIPLTSNTTWTPCIRRELKLNPFIPSMVEIAIALTKNEFMEFSLYMQKITAYIHSAIGGDMETSGCPSDPMFYSVHAYIDMLFWRWQKRHSKKSPNEFSLAILSANTIPFNTEQQFLLDSEYHLCVSYENSIESSLVDADENGDFESGCVFNSPIPASKVCNEQQAKAVLHAGQKIQTVLYNQDEFFLRALPRTCQSPENAAPIHNNQWAFQPDSNIPLLTEYQAVQMQTDLCKRFCFTADVFLESGEEDPDDSCSSQNVPICDESVLKNCPYYTYAPCKLSLCHNCSITCHVEEREVECSPSKMDFCDPNPCENNGFCVPSKWPTMLHLVSCECQPDFEGEFCEQKARHPCHLSLNPGKSINGCNNPEKRWYYNVENQECQSFLYHGCLGNSNNFRSNYECRISCIIGACCWRSPRYPDRIYGYNEEGYDRYGFNLEGRSPKHEKRTMHNSVGGDKAIFRYSGFDYQGYDKNGLNADEYDRFDYNSLGFHRVTKFNLTGYDVFGDNDGMIDFHHNGYDSDGYSRAGLNCQGHSKEGWDYFGLSTGWNFDCRPKTLKDCKHVENEYPQLKQQVTMFSLGKKCEDVEYESLCGCNFLQKFYPISSQFALGCSVCECQKSGRISCPCTSIGIRKEIRDMTAEELSRYQNAIKTLHLQKPVSSWQNLTDLYSQFHPHSYSGFKFLPWNRFFLRLMEMKLQEVDCAINIPYFDWRMDVGDLLNSVIWQANYFGGNGDPERDDCVLHHPFKNHHSQYWTPCLRRRFNSSIQLPNAVSIERILRMNFEDFTSQMERMSSLFHLFVGGHMTSPESAYDPIFLSHYTFVDKLWNDWELRIADSSELYPLEYRYVPMIPFGIVPDDVLILESQLCIKYADINKGAPCVSQHAENSIVDEISFKDFDVNGFDKYGYHVSGYDKMGWDRKGFNKDSFNRDGFDRSGFDRNGFNRYGFDGHGCNSQGYCLYELTNSIDLNFRNVPWDEYGDLGFNSNGFDFHGYDIYGFNFDGYDKENCSFFSEGPFYAVILKQVEMELKQIKDGDLDSIKYLCPDVSTVPKWWAASTWFNRDEQSLSRNFYPKLVKPRYESNNLPLASIYTNWLAPMPDQRFCFELHVHTKCGLNEPPVSCPHKKCSTPFCTSFPSARCRHFGCGSCEKSFIDVINRKPTSCNHNACSSVDGIIRRNGETWEEDCNLCLCKEGFVTCSETNCENDCGNVNDQSRLCCPPCEGCIHEGISYPNGASFTDPHNSCSQIKCVNGSILDIPLKCEPVKNCEQNDVVTLPAECCPTCTSCGTHSTDVYWMETPCRNCSCVAGSVVCSDQSCPAPRCYHPAKTAGQCCSTCNDCYYKGLHVKNEDHFVPESCTECHCQQGNVMCQNIDCSHPKCLKTSPEYDKCCHSCQKECNYDEKWHKHGDNFVPTFNPCLNCSCQNALVRCQPVSCPDMKEQCKLLVFLPGACCPTCPKCVVKGKEFGNGDTWQSDSDSCETCTCLNGLVQCSRHELCKTRKCTHGVVPSGACCSPCIDCEFNGHVVMNNMLFSPPDDPCSRCSCQNGNISCVRDTCPELLCKNPISTTGSCCAVCKGCTDSAGNEIEHGSQWIHPSDKCQMCLCQEGVSRCERILCETRCTHSLLNPGSCCPDCSGCQVSGVTYLNNDEVPMTDPCTRCFCYEGNLECESTGCPTVTCDNPVIEPGKCCPSCEECSYQGLYYNDGEVFQLLSDPCYQCNCQKGVVECKKSDVYCNPQCSNAVSLPEQCCPLCDGCYYKGNRIKNKDVFTPNPYKPCQQCECLDGNVRCFTHRCPVLNCANPVTSALECCKKCPQSCVDVSSGSLVHNEGDMWIPTDNQCQICTCQRGTVTCDSIPCSETKCHHPATPFGHCCPECEHCEFTRRLYRNGQQFTHNDDPCQICNCENGSVSCETVLCDPLPCSHPEPLEGLCCPICSPKMDCHFHGKTYEAWENFMDPENSCSECVCIEGMVSCHQVMCLNTDCPNPLAGHCCDSCEGCSYGEKNYNNLILFDDPYNSCRQCHCEGGFVSCKQQLCDVVTCDHPIFIEGECCPICKECKHHGIRYQIGAVFNENDDPCSECTCEFPDVLCKPKDCSAVNCSNPIAPLCCEKCAGCLFEGISFEEKSEFIHPKNSCETCKCQEGTVYCSKQVCPDITCAHPTYDDCCPMCKSGCFFENFQYTNWQTFPHPYDRCKECNCRKGNVTCRHKLCLNVACSHPSFDGCCPACNDCIYRNELIKNGEAVHPFDGNSCSNCTCLNGSIECVPKSCPDTTCSHPVLTECCPECNYGCLYDEKVYKLGSRFDQPDNDCFECLCEAGSVKCSKKQCETPNCINSIMDDAHCCPYCPLYCSYEGKTYLNGSAFPHSTDSCKECTCKDGDVKCAVKLCPAAPCLHPAKGHCCSECVNCQFLGKRYSNGEDFSNPEIACEKCLCSKGQVACEKTSCPTCLHPISNNTNCCPLCEGCFYKGLNYTNQQQFTPQGDPCEECICKKGTVTCHQLSCSSPACSNPVSVPGICCPICQGCTGFGTTYGENTEFAHPKNPCETCHCRDGMIACNKQPCTVSCTHPMPDVCCPSCNECMFDGNAYANGQTFNPDPCRTCECKDGNVKCVTETCVHLSCQLRVRNPGQCCEKCRGCVYEGIEYESNATWTSSRNPCLSCKCVGGTVLCKNMICPVKCLEPVPVPGLCCPVCADCERDGLIYHSGDTFRPRHRPCDTCTCDSGHIFCIRHECPELFDCPPDSIKPPGDGECCPTCAGFGTSCSREQIGHQVQPTPDPCLVCQCMEDYKWLCTKEFCPPLDCPSDQVIKNENECCSKCKACVSQANRTVHSHGSSWLLASDPCSLCNCEYGEIKCENISCPTLQCGFEQVAYKVPGSCCEICASSDLLVCEYGDHQYENGQIWNPDSCTTCRCSGGKMNCQNQRCLPLHCTSDEIPSVDPGQCCPKCIPRPATCLAFGDPHYRTFDGASISFQGTCRYILAADCSTQKFSIIVENNDRGFNGVSWTHRVVVALQNASVDLRAGPAVFIRGKPINQLPYFDNPILYIENTGTSVLVTTDIGVQVLWSGDGYVEVVVSGVYRGKTCGLCGNFNNFPEDDMRTPTNEIVTSEAKFGNSWKNRGFQPYNCVEAVDIDPCSKGGYRTRKMANNKCSILKQISFAACHPFIAPEPYFAACVYDVCACSENDDCLCDILSAYSLECAKAGVVLNWRTEGLCDIHCPEEEGFVFDECGPPCSRTCENRNVPIGVLASQCFKPCVPGCQCSADKVLYSGKCIRPEHCP